MKRLSDIRPDQECILEEIHGGWGLTRRLAEMGLFRGVRLRVLSSGPWRGSVYIEILPAGTRCSVGHGAASRIMVEPVEPIPPKLLEDEPQDNDREPEMLCRRTTRARGRGWRFWRRG
ncbi:MAG: FeoA family protein [candidate division WOR-3 bacterium]